MILSLRTRLLLAVLLAALIALVIVDVVTYTLVTRAQVAQVDRELERSHPPIERAAATDGDIKAAVRAVAPASYVEVRGRQGRGDVVVPLLHPGARAEELRKTRLEPSAHHGDDAATYATTRADDDGGALRVRVSRQDDGAVLVIGVSLRQVEQTRHRLLGVLIAGTLGALVMVGAVGAWLVRVGLRPLTDLQRAAAEITSSDLDRRMPGASPGTEFGRLATAINTMVDRLHAAILQHDRDAQARAVSEERMRRFVADASHELRTPLAATAAYAELFERGARDHPDDLARAMGGIRTETARMAELVDDLLLLAQLDEGRPLAVTSVDLAEVAAEAVMAARVLAPDRSVDLRIDDVAVVAGDPGRLRQVVDNLLANVRAHTGPGVACRVEVRSDDPAALIIVEDDGEGLRPEELQAATERFYRADPSRDRRRGGAGLGLSIVSAIVAAHHGTMTLTTPQGHGLRVVIRLPIPSPGNGSRRLSS